MVENAAVQTSQGNTRQDNVRQNNAHQSSARSENSHSVQATENLQNISVQAPVAQVLTKSSIDNLDLNLPKSATKNKSKPKSAATLIRELIVNNESKLTEDQKNKMFDREFISKYCGISMDLLIPSDDDNKRYINGRPRYMKRPITFMGKNWYITNDIHKKSIARFNALIEYFLSTGGITPPEPEKNKKAKTNI